MKKHIEIMILDKYIFSEHAEDVIKLLKKNKIKFIFMNLTSFTGLPVFAQSFFELRRKGIYNFELFIPSNDFNLVKELLEEEGRKLAKKFKGDIFISYSLSELKEIAANPQEWGFFYSELAKMNIIRRKELSIIPKIELKYTNNYNSITSFIKEDM